MDDNSQYVTFYWLTRPYYISSLISRSAVVINVIFFIQAGDFISLICARQEV
jgi:hypothetical protein